MSAFLGAPQRLINLEGRDLVNRVRKLFHEDAHWRDQCIGGSTGYQQMIRDYESVGKASDGSDIPELPQIREPINDAISLAAGSNNKTRMLPVEILDPSLTEERRKFLQSVMHKSADTVDRHLNTIMAANQWPDLRNSIITSAGVFGSGCLYAGVRHQVDTRNSFQARYLLSVPREQWTEKEFLLYNKLFHDIGMRQVDTRNVFWQQGVTSAFDENMMRVSVHEKKSVSEMRAAYPGIDIRPGRGVYFLDQYEPAMVSEADTVGVVTMWQLEADSEVMMMGDPSAPSMRIPFTAFRLVEVKIAGDQVCHKRVYDGMNGPLKLPIIPYYIIESLNHPYGFSMARALKITSDYINSLYSLMFEQARKAVSPQSFAIMMSKLSKHDNVENMVDQLRDGDPIQLWANEEIDDIRQIMQGTGQLQSQMNPAPMQAISMAENLMRRYAANPDRDAIASAESGRAKETEIAIADRTKTPIQDLIARSDEAVKDLLYENVRVYQNTKFPTTVKSADGSFVTEVMNEPKVELLPVNHLVTGMPLQDETYVSPVNPEGFVYDPLEYVSNNTQIEMRAQAEGRGDIPITWRARLQMFSQLMSVGALQSGRTARDFILPDEIAARDDVNFMEDMQRQQAMMAEQEQAGTSPQQQNRNAQAGRNAPQPNADRRDMGQDRALSDQTQLAVSP